MSPDDVKCEECSGTGYWSNYPPKQDEPLDMMDCCGVCCGKGYLSPAEVAEIARDFVPESHHDDCETCGRQDETMFCCQDTIFCAGCWGDFGTDRWKGIGSKLATQTPEPAPGNASKRDDHE